MKIRAPSTVPDNLATQGGARWSKAERKIARRAFEHALKQELQEVMQKVKEMAAEIKGSSELWELEQYLTQRREEINHKYEYRGAKLRFVFGTLLHEGRLTEEHLRGLSEDKAREFRSYADFLRTADEPIEMMVAGRRSGDGQ
jgi:Photoprotection regulator fluorescence recovery protein